MGAVGSQASRRRTSLTHEPERPSAPGWAFGLWERRGLMWALALLLFGLTVAAQLTALTTPDTGFLLYAAGRMLDGAHLYRDIVEINPPLILWLNLPVVWLARRLHVSDLHLYVLTTAIGVGVLLLFSRRLARRYALDDAPGLRRYLLLLLCIGFFPFAGVDFGEREQFVLALLLPYVFLTVAQLRGRRLPLGDATVAGALAGVALALKPHFVLVWFLLELLRRWQMPGERWRIRPEAGAMIGVLGLYMLLIVLVTPEYLFLAGFLGPTYAKFLRDPFFHLLFLAPGAALVLFALLAYVALRSRLEWPVLTATFCVATAACYLAGAAQEKGFPYHFYPALVLGLVLLGLLARTEPSPDWRVSERLYAFLLKPVALTVALIAFGATLVTLTGGGPEARRQRRECLDDAAVVRAHAAGRPVGILSFHLGSAFPLLNYAGVPLAIRFPHLWILPASYWDSLTAGGALRYRNVEEMPPVERWMYAAVEEDLLATQPNVLMVLRPARDSAPNGLRRLHYIRYFERQPELKAFLAHYELLEHRGEFDLYQRLDDDARRTAPPPSDLPGTQDVKHAEVGKINLALGDPKFASGVAVFALLVVGFWARRRRGGRGVERRPLQQD
jgi:hypothetical protein